jgi:translation initiation factor RLI1
MDGFIPSENLRFRDYSLSFNISEKDDEEIRSINSYAYPTMAKTFDNKFKLTVSGNQKN